MADHTDQEYKPVKFYADNTTPKKAGFSKFQVGDSYFFCRYVDSKIAMLSQAYTSQAGRDNGIESVKKNEKLAKRYTFESRGSQGHGFGLKAGNGMEIAISPNYGSSAESQRVASRMSGASFGSKASGKTTTSKKAAPKKRAAKLTATKDAASRKTAPKKAATKTVKRQTAREEDNYPPLAFYRRHTKGKQKGFEKFQGDDGEHYFTYFDNGKMALISEGYPTAPIRDVGLASVRKNMKIEKRYVQSKGADGKPGFILRAGNHKEIARSVGYGSAAAAVAGAGYLLGTRRRPSAAASTTKKTAKPPAKKTVRAKAAPAPKPPVKRKKSAPVKAAAPVAAAGIAAAGIAAKKAAPPKSAKPKVTKVKKVSVPVKPASVKPKPTPEAKPSVTKLAAGGVAAAGLGASAAKPKPAPVPKPTPPAAKAPSVPVKAAAIVAAPIAAAAVGAAALTGSKDAPKAAAPAQPAAAAKASPIAGATSAAATPAAAAAGGSGIWGWLKWLLLALIALLAMFFLFKSCAGDSNEAATIEPAVTETANSAPTPAPEPAPATTPNPAPAPAVMATCWNGSKAEDEAACPAKVTCWDGSFATSNSACPVKEVAAKPLTRTSPKGTAPTVAGRICGPTSNALSDVRNSTPISVGRLGTNPQFGNSLGLTPQEFFRKLQGQYQTNQSDRAFLNFMARSLGYRAFTDMDASMFTNDVLANGTSGNLGFGTSHALQFSTLNVSDPSHLEAFKVRSNNGSDVHFMKRCGNFMYVCQP